MLPKELHQLKSEAISVPQGSVRLVKKTQERKSSTCYLLITKGVTSSKPSTTKDPSCRGEMHALFSYTKAFGDGPRNFEPWSSDVDDT
ncbi:hypothetical protein TNCV_3101921 [Trichonephila clavipes]|nr:hypothetical protein TNCV_3101921 [Trichonephila clavipes]